MVIFYLDVVVVQTDILFFILKGVDLHINKLNLESSELCLEGEISSCTYSEKTATTGSFLGKIFK